MTEDGPATGNKERKGKISVFGYWYLTNAPTILSDLQYLVPVDSRVLLL